MTSDQSRGRDPRVAALAPILHSFGLDSSSLSEIRANVSAFTAALEPPDDVDVAVGELAGRDVVVIHPPEAASTRRILYLHGGGFCYGSARHQLSVPSRLALATGLDVVSPELRLAPEHPCPAQTQDAVAVYEALLAADTPVTAIAGDSSGGAVALLATVALRDAGVPLPDALVAFSAWTDLSGRSQRFRDQSFQDPVLPRSLLEMSAAAYLDGRRPGDPAATPLSADLAGLPPTLLHVGSDELLLGDTLTTAEALANADVDVTAHVWPRMIHVFVAYPQLVPESAAAVAESAGFIAAHRPR